MRRLGPSILPLLALLSGCASTPTAAQAPPAQAPPAQAAAAETPAAEASPSATPPSGAGEKPAPAGPAATVHVTPPAPGSVALADGDLATIASPCGLYVVISWRGNSLLALLAGRELKTMNPPNPKVWLLDGALVELSVVTASQIEAKDLLGKPLLDHFRTWELTWAAKQNGWKVPEPQVFMSEPSRPGSGLDAQVWAFTAPGKMEVLGVPVTGMSFATLAFDDLILTTAVPFRPGDDPQRALQIFVSLFGTAQKEASPPDVAALALQVRQEAAADPTCKRVHKN